MLRLVPPAGAPLPTRALLSSIVQRPRGAHPPGVLACEMLGVGHAAFVSSGRAALTVLLDALQTGSRRREVVVPAYTCFSVPSAVARAGLRLRLCDIDPRTLDLDLNALRRLDLSQVLCIVPSGLYGLPGHLVELEKLAAASGAALIDDAAQTLGGSVDGRPCGTFGDAGFFSLGRGKNITTMGGGLLVTQRSDLAAKIEMIVSGLPRPSVRETSSALGSALVYAGMVKPSRYWAVDRMTFLGLGGSHFEPEFPIAQLSAYQQRLTAQLLPLVDTFNKARRDHADHLRAGIEGVEGIEIPRPVAGANAVYLRFPILARDTAHRDRLFHRLGRAGIRASASYPTAVGDIPSIERYLASGQAACPAARAVAARILTLPTHAWVTPADVERMVAVIREEARA